jgi:hypothetical protein
MSVNLSPVAGAAAQFLDNSGNVLTGGKLYTYLAGTTTPAAVYTSSTGTQFHSNPIILDAAGRVPNGGEIWLADSTQYKFVLKDANDVLLGTWDNLTGINSNFVNYTTQEEIIVATAGQTVFNLTTVTYVPGTNSLQVYVDGVNQYDGVTYAYVETDATTVTFTAGLHVGALVKFTTAISVSAGSVNANLVVYDPPFTASVSTDAETKFAEIPSVKDFGAIGNGIVDDTTAIQNALDACSGVLLPIGTYKITAPLRFNNDNFLYGEGHGSVINATQNDAIIKGNAVTPISGTGIRRYRGGGRDFSIAGPGIASTGSIGLDMRGCSQFKWFNVGISSVYTGVRQGNNYATFYNEYHACDISAVHYGYLNDTLGNENLVVGGRVNDSVIGTSDSDCSHNVYIKCAIEVFTTGHLTVSPASVCIQYISSRLESGTTGVLIDASSQDTVLMYPQYETLTTEVTDNGTYTIRFDNLGLKTRNGSLITCISKQKINKAIGPIGAGAVSQISFTLTPPTGTSFLPGDTATITLPQSWPGTLMAAPLMTGGTNTFILPVYNPTASPVSLAAADYVFTVIKG